MRTDILPMAKDQCERYHFCRVGEMSRIVAPHPSSVVWNTLTRSAALITRIVAITMTTQMSRIPGALPRIGGQGRADRRHFPILLRAFCMRAWRLAGLEHV
jgi:hypothetical protein